MLQLLSDWLDLRGEYTNAIGTTKSEIIDTGVLFSFRPWLLSLEDLYPTSSVQSFTSMLTKGGNDELTLRFHFSKGIAELGTSKLALGGTNPFSKHRAALITDTMPLACSRCPTFALTDPTRRGSWDVLSWQNTARKAAASMGSPTCNLCQYLRFTILADVLTRVPVPCAST